MTAPGVDVVKPRYLSIPEYDSNRTLGPEVAAVATLAGFPPDPEQRLLLDATFALDKNGKSVAYEIVVIAPRQNLKTGFFKQVALGWLFVRDEPLTVWSAHEFDTANEALNDIEALIDSSDTLRKRVKLTARGNVASHGAVPEIALKSGARLKVKTRTGSGGRGLSGRKVLLDEAFALQPPQVGALDPIMLAQPDPQKLIGSSACRPDSVVLWDVVQRGRAGNDPRMVYAEWCAPDPEEVCELGEKCDHSRITDGCGCDNPELLLPVHSAITRGRIQLQTVADLRRTMPPEEYGREVMGWHDEPVGVGQQFPKALWPGLVNVDAPRPQGPALALEVAWDRSAASIATAGRVDDTYHLDVLEYRPGTSWVLQRLLELVGEINPCAVVLDPAGPGGAFEAELLENGFATDPLPAEQRLYLVTGRAFAQACGALIDDVKNDEVRHRNRPELNEAVQGVVTRKVSEAYAWSRIDSTTDICPLVAVTLARHGFAVYGAPEYDLLASVPD